MASRIERVRTGILTVTAVLALASGAWAQDIKIGIPVGLSGANSVVAPSVVQSAELAAEEINAKGGIMGKKVMLEVADDGSGAARAISAAPGRTACPILAQLLAGEAAGIARDRPLVGRVRCAYTHVRSRPLREADGPQRGGVCALRSPLRIPKVRTRATAPGDRWPSDRTSAEGWSASSPGC